MPARQKPNRAGRGADKQDKFFILKSLTMEDLELSVRTGIWATQSHNEETLNHSFKVCIRGSTGKPHSADDTTC